MEDDKGLDLSLGLPVGGSSSRPKDRNDSNTSDTANDDVDRTLKIVNDFKNFLNGGTPQQMPNTGFQRFDVLKPQGNYFGNFHHASAVGDASGDAGGRRFWTPGTEIEVDVGEKDSNPIVGEKRKNSYEELENNQKKQETETRTSDLLDKTRASHISLTTEDGSTADNEDVAESEAATSRSVSNLEDSSKQHVSGASNSSDVSKEMHEKVSGGSSHPLFSWQTESMMNVSRSISITESGQVVSGPGRGMLSYPVSSMVVASTANVDRPQSSDSFKVMMNFGYPQGQIPSMDKDHLQGLIVTQGQPVHPPFVSRGPTASDGKQPAAEVEESSLSSRAEDALKPSSSALKSPAESEDPLEYPSIRPGLAAELKFGGSGSVPNLPWVSTTAPGPNGRTISGVSYKFSASQIKIVCACHGRHFSPEEFTQHALEEPLLSLPGPGGANSNNAVAVTSGGSLASVAVSTTNTASASVKS